ncbi:hypothetical protein ACQKL0_10495 [Peribacillus sp. NPDC097264]|uniref:hypothetical protein n=1 Tax=Peribacillus sp. NPDC097264 TaxID=3390616 RepID=UPI003CFC8CDE
MGDTTRVETKILFYKRYEGKAKAIDYVNWAYQKLIDGSSVDSLKTLASFREPLNQFEVEDYFQRVIKEWKMPVPTHEECAKAYLHHLLRQIVGEDRHVTHIAYEVYEVVREHFNELNVWYDISEMIDEFHCGENRLRGNLTWEQFLSMIKREAEKQLESEFFLQ